MGVCVHDDRFRVLVGYVCAVELCVLISYHVLLILCQCTMCANARQCKLPVSVHNFLLPHLQFRHTYTHGIFCIRVGDGIARNCRCHPCHKGDRKQTRHALSLSLSLLQTAGIQNITTSKLQVRLFDELTVRFSKELNCRLPSTWP